MGLNKGVRGGERRFSEDEGECRGSEGGGFDLIVEMRMSGIRGGERGDLRVLKEGEEDDEGYKEEWKG